MDQDPLQVSVRRSYLDHNQTLHGYAGHSTAYPFTGVSWERAPGDWSCHVRGSLGSGGSGEELGDGKVGHARGADPGQVGEQVQSVHPAGRTTEAGTSSQNSRLRSCGLVVVAQSSTTRAGKLATADGTTYQNVQ